MTTITVALLVLLLLVLLALIVIVIWLAMRVTKPFPPNNEQLADLTGKLDAIQRQVATFTGKLDAIQKQVDSNLQSMTNQVSVFGEVKETLGKVTEATHRVAQLGEDINKLESILQAPNRRGGFGEILLGNLLGQVLPERYFQLQFLFRNNTRVDAVLLLGQRILPVDSKFPLYGFDGNPTEDHKTSGAFVRSVKGRIDETAKYILPAEGTFEFAMMYIPAENVYYEIVSNEELFNYAMQKRVIPVSPNSFFAYLQVIVFGLRGLQIEENARQILEHISTLKLTLDGVQELYDKLGTNIATTQNKYNELGKKLNKFSNQFERLAAETMPEESGSLLLTESNPVFYAHRAE